MGESVSASSAAPPAQQHVISASDNSGTEVCGRTVQQGESITVDVDDNLVATVSANGWDGFVGPNFIVETENAYMQPLAGAQEDERGCSNTRLSNPTADLTVVPLNTGTMTIRLLSAYEYGQVYASPECTMEVAGSRTVVQMSGFLVDITSFETDATLATMPYELTVGQLLNATAFGILEKTEDEGEFVIKYQLDAEGNSQAIELLESMDDTSANNVQVSITGFEASSSAEVVEVLALTSCASSSTCDGFFSIPTDQVCITDGLCVESSVLDMDAGTLTTTIVSNDGSWFGIGFSTPGGGMTGGGAGSDIFVCSSEGLRRFVVTAKTNPSSQSTEIITEDAANAEEIKNLCVLEAGSGRMTFTRTLAGAREIIPNEAQAIIWARGPGEQSLSTRHDRRGEVSLDLTNVSGGVATTKQTPEWILWLHIVFMSLSWGILLPMGAVIANRTRNVGKPGAWFVWHKSLGRIGWTLQTIGALCAIYYAEVYAGAHFEFTHAKYGIFIVVAGFLQPISAVLRPHPPKGGWPDGNKSPARWAFEAWHKGFGWTTVISGFINVILGVKLVGDLGFESTASTVPIILVIVGFAFFAGFMVMGLVAPENPLALALTGGSSYAGGKKNDDDE
eukprot:CAMPEP_0118687782 /NCGR_PEP_ID=MMETSP0800-20121206/8570_1 /TAXON_ID=210618 ORGANISM="Striatella unipunctata, Strain CCMP2910" /NCGR_SAMPLE_ID=MMETSP0800 /ASSEMBLY_ACC=CAM_ASM_000638 /LENGTH=620 /DNA_ID=CAMNT_0006584997 /DNA_START=413 /DNA_END=2275 /DNA_ORIENTATION=+